MRWRKGWIQCSTCRLTVTQLCLTAHMIWTESSAMLTVTPVVSCYDIKMSYVKDLFRTLAVAKQPRLQYCLLKTSSHYNKAATAYRFCGKRPRMSFFLLTQCGLSYAFGKSQLHRLCTVHAIRDKERWWIEFNCAGQRWRLIKLLLPTAMVSLFSLGAVYIIYISSRGTFRRRMRVW